MLLPQVGAAVVKRVVGKNPGRVGVPGRQQYQPGEQTVQPGVRCKAVVGRIMADDEQDANH